MCGFTGQYVLSNDGPAGAANVIERGLRLRHRGPDQFGTWLGGSVGVASARLALLDLEHGVQPMQDPRGTVLVYNGEIYNSLELRAELTVRGWDFRTRSDAEVLLAAYETWGEDAWARLNGMFAAAIYDQNRGQLILVRDRLGIKPLFYRVSQGHVEFASEPGAWSDCRSSEAPLDVRGVLHYLRFAQTVSGCDTMLAGLHTLEPGGTLIAHDGRSEVKRWHVPRLCDSVEQPLDDLVTRARLRHLLHLAVGRQLVADAPIGMLLSGGLDSTLLVGLARQMTPEPLRTFSVALTDDEDDLICAARVAAHWSTIHTELRVTPARFLSAMRELTKLRAWPVSLPNEVLIYCITREARHYVKAVLSGEGADELFGGYSNMLSAFVARQSNPEDSLNDYLNDVYCWFRRDELHRLLNRTWQEHLNIADAPLPGIEASQAWPGSDGLSDLMNWLEFHHLPHLLARLDGASMGGSIEGRVPYTDNDLVDYVLRLPPERRFTTLGLDKPLLREVFADLVPEFVLNRPKRAFHASLDRLLLSTEGERERARVANDPRMSEIFDMDQLRTWMRCNTHPAALYPQWLLLSLNLWLNRNLM